MVSKIQLNEKQLKKNDLPTWDVERKVITKKGKYSKLFVSRRCLKCGVWFKTRINESFVLCRDCGKK